MSRFSLLSAALRDALLAGGVPAAVCEYPAQRLPAHSAPVVTVGVKSIDAPSAGFGDYLGEQFDEAEGVWRELYGRRAELVFGLWVYAPRDDASGCQRTVEALAGSLSALPAGLRAKRLSCGETVYDPDTRMYRCEAELSCSATLYAVRLEGGLFSDFRLLTTVKPSV